MTVQIRKDPNVQEIGISTLKKSGLIKHEDYLACVLEYKNYSDLKAGYYNLMKEHE